MTRPSRVSEPAMWDRSRLTMGRPGSKATVEGPSKRPARSPCTSRARAWATSRPSAAQLARCWSPARARPGSKQGVDHGGQHGDGSRACRRAARAASRAVRSTGLQGVGRGWLQPGRPAGSCAAGRPAPARRRRRCRLGRGPSSRGLSRAGRPTPSSMTWPPDGAGDGAPFAFGVAGHVDAPAEGDAAGGEGLGQGGFAPADLAGQEDVGVGQHARAGRGPRGRSRRRCPTRRPGR